MALLPNERHLLIRLAEDIDTVSDRPELNNRAANQRHVIVRTGWVYDATGRNFLTRILDAAANNDGPLHIVADQRGNPTYAPHLAKLLLALTRRVLSATRPDMAWGLYHVAAAGSATWYEFAREISANLERIGKATLDVKPIGMAQYATTAKRPQNCILDCKRVESRFSIKPPEWQAGVRACIDRWRS